MIVENAVNQTQEKRGGTVSKTLMHDHQGNALCMMVNVASVAINRSGVQVEINALYDQGRGHRHYVAIDASRLARPKFAVQPSRC